MLEADAKSEGELTLAKWLSVRLISLAKWLSVRLRTKWFWVRVQLQSLHHASHMVKHNTETSHTDVNTANFKITDMDFSNNKRKRKIAESLRIKDLRPRLNVQEKSIPLKLLN